MAKKQKRAVSKSVESKAPSTTTSTSEVRPFSASRSYTSEFNPDYSYVVKDLKRIGFLAGTFITLLVVLSFFLR
jgi:hypothetical protein